MAIVRSFESRLRKLEAAHRPEGAVFFLAWGRDEAEAESVADRALARGVLRWGDTVVQAAWPGSDPRAGSARIA